MGWGGWWPRVRSCRQAKANIQTQMAVLCQSIGDPDWHNSQGMPGLPLESV